MPSKRPPVLRRRRHARPSSRAVRHAESHARPIAQQKSTEDSRARPADSGLAPEMQALNTYLAVANVKASMEFLERAFGFTRGVVLPGTDGQPRYAEMRHGRSVVMLVPKGDATSATGA